MKIGISLSILFSIYTRIINNASRRRHDIHSKIQYTIEYLYTVYTLYTTTSHHVIWTLVRCLKRRKFKIPGWGRLPQSHRCSCRRPKSTSSDNRSCHGSATWNRGNMDNLHWPSSDCVSASKNALQARGEVHGQVQPDRTRYVITALIRLANFGDQDIFLQTTLRHFVLCACRVPNVKSIIDGQFYYREILDSVSFICMYKDTYRKRHYVFRYIFVRVDRAQTRYMQSNT